MAAYVNWTKVRDAQYRCLYECICGVTKIYSCRCRKFKTQFQLDLQCVVHVIIATHVTTICQKYNMSNHNDSQIWYNFFGDHYTECLLTKSFHYTKISTRCPQHAFSQPTKSNDTNKPPYLTNIPNTSTYSTDNRKRAWNQSFQTESVFKTL